MESIGVHPLLTRIWAAVRIVFGFALLFFVLLIEDWSLWLVPKALPRRDVKAFRQRCENLRPGMSQAQVLEIMHRGVAPWYEYEFQHSAPWQGSVAEHGMEFSGGKGTCKVWFEATGQTVATVKYYEGAGSVTVGK